MTIQINELDKQDSIFNQFIAEIRDVDIQKDSLRFRRNLERVGELMAYEISKVMHFESRSVKTSLGECECRVLAEQPHASCMRPR